MSFSKPSVDIDNPQLARLARENVNFLTEYDSANTRRTYESQMRFFHKHCEDEGVTDVSHDPHVLANAMVKKQKLGLAESTINTGLVSAVGDHFRFAPFANPAHSLVVQEMKKRIKKATPPPGEYKEADKGLVLRIILVIDEATQDAVRMFKMLSALRCLRDRSTVVMAFVTWARPQSLVDLHKIDVVRVAGPPEHLILSFQGHQVDHTSGPKNKKGDKHKSEVARCPEQLLDLIGVLDRYNALEEVVFAERRRMSPSFQEPKYVFYNTIDKADRFGCKLHPDTLNSSFKGWLNKVDLSPTETTKGITFYGVKFGGVSASRRAGTTSDQRKKHGGWSSNAHKGYDKQNKEEVLAVSQRF
jgi:hypothetical protein